MKYKLAIYILLMALFGCATESQITELQRKETDGYTWISTLPYANADYGSYPTDYKEIIKKYLEISSI
jgi:hypothetical protein